VTSSVVEYDGDLPAIPNHVSWEEPTAHLIREAPGEYAVREGRRPSKALLVNRLRAAVNEWRRGGYPGSSDVTQDLFRFWFEEDHQLADGSEFRYYFGQREAVETLAYLVEIRGYTDIKPLIDDFGEAFSGGLFNEGIRHQTATDGSRSIVRFFPEAGSEGTQALPPEDLTRYAFKMATGSGKTIVMAMIIAWSYFHRARVPGSSLSRNFLVVAPNVIVYQRLEKDFQSNRVFEELPLVPHGWTLDLKPILRGESAEPSPNGTLILTNIQQLHQSREKEWTPASAVEAMLGRPVTKDLGSHERSLLERIRSLPDLIAINDEAHHVHDADLEWSKTLLSLKDKLRLWLDFSATPKSQTGTFFPWIICDYPLPQAVEDQIVKAPLIVQRVDHGDPEKVTKDNVVQAYADWIHAAVKRWREHEAAYAPVGQKPVLFIMAEQSAYADAIGKWLIETKEFGLKPKEVQIIHTNASGEILKGDLEAAREAVRTIDDPGNPVKVIVSVLMLREGWDVRSVSVVLGLRPFTAKAQILPEQAVGRGLRLMPGVEGRQTLEVMGTRAFEDFVAELEQEGLPIGKTKTPPPLPVKIEPIRERAQYDIAIPLTQPLLERSYAKLAQLNPEDIGPIDRLADLRSDPEMQFVLNFMTTGSKVGEVRVGYPILVPQEAISRLVDSAARKANIPGRFHELYPIIERYIRDVAFARPVDLDDEPIAIALSKFSVREQVAAEIAKRIGSLTVETKELEFDNAKFRLSEVETFLWRRIHFAANHTIFNFVTAYNNYERRFAECLDGCSDVPRWAALATHFTKFNVTYLNKNGALKRYYPDFVAVQTTVDGEVNWIIETKGRMFEDVEYKDKGTRQWCRVIAEETLQDWRYMRVDQLIFDKGKFERLENLVAAVEAAQSPRLAQVIDAVDVLQR
jgi:type III restriction enzyme